MSTTELTALELEAAEAMGMTPEQYEVFKSPQPQAGVRKLEKAAEEERLKAIVRSVLDERDAAGGGS